MIESNVRYSWDPAKRVEILNSRRLDIVLLADFIFTDPNIVIVPDIRKNYGEDRFKAFAKIEEERFCLCFTLRADKIHLITIFRQHNNSEWRKNYEKI